MRPPRILFRVSIKSIVHAVDILEPQSHSSSRRWLDSYECLSMFATYNDYFIALAIYDRVMVTRIVWRLCAASCGCQMVELQWLSSTSVSQSRRSVAVHRLYPRSRPGESLGSERQGIISKGSMPRFIISLNIWASIVRSSLSISGLRYISIRVCVY